MNQEGYGLGGIFRKIGRFFKPLGRELGNIGLTVGVDLIQSLINDIIAGKSSRASAKAHGRQSAQRATDLATIRALQLIKERQKQQQRQQKQQQRGGTWFDKDLSDPPPAVRGLAHAKQKGGKRKRSQSANQPAKKRKRSQSVRKRKTTQKGGNLFKDLYKGYMEAKRKGEEARKRKRKAKKKGGRKKTVKQRGGRKSGRVTKRRKPTKRRTVVSAKRMSVKQRKALPKDIFG